MATYYTGCSGDFILGGTSVLVSKWTFKDTLSTTEVMAKGDGGFNYSLGCSRKGEGTFEGFLDEDVHNTSPFLLKAGKSAAFELELSLGGDSISGTALIKEVSIEHDYKGVAKYSGSFETRGAYYLPGEPTS